MLGLVVRGSLTYLVTVYWEYDDPRLLLMHRIKSAQVTEQPAREPKGFSFDAYVNSGEIDWPVGPMIKLKLDIVPDLVRVLEETPLSGDQRIGAVRRGWARLTATVQDTMELRGWVGSLRLRAKRRR